MKKFFATLLLAAAGFLARAQNNIGINTTPDASAALDVTFTTGTPKGVLVPRMTTSQRTTGITSPAIGLLVYDTDLSSFYFYNGASWVALGGGGGTTLPSQSGNAGKFLTTDGTNLSWGSAAPNLPVLAVSKNVAVTTSVGSSLSLPDVVTFQATNSNSNMPASIDTWTGNNTFTAVTAGWYWVDVQLVGNITIPVPMLDFNNSGNSSSSYYGTGYSGTTTLQSPYKQRGTLQRLFYMAANQTFQIRAASSSTASGTEISGDGTSYVRVMKVN